MDVYVLTKDDIPSTPKDITISNILKVYSKEELYRLLVSKQYINILGITNNFINKYFEEGEFLSFVEFCTQYSDDITINVEGLDIKKRKEALQEQEIVKLVAGQDTLPRLLSTIVKQEGVYETIVKICKEKAIEGNYIDTGYLHPIVNSLETKLRVTEADSSSKDLVIKKQSEKIADLTNKLDEVVNRIAMLSPDYDNVLKEIKGKIKNKYSTLQYFKFIDLVASRYKFIQDIMAFTEVDGIPLRYVVILPASDKIEEKLFLDSEVSEDFKNVTSTSDWELKNYAKLYMLGYQHEFLLHLLNNPNLDPNLIVLDFTRLPVDITKEMQAVVKYYMANSKYTAETAREFFPDLDEDSNLILEDEINLNDFMVRKLLTIL